MGIRSIIKRRRIKFHKKSVKNNTKDIKILKDRLVIERKRKPQKSRMIRALKFDLRMSKNIIKKDKKILKDLAKKA